MEDETATMRVKFRNEESLYQVYQGGGVLARKGGALAAGNFG